MNIIIFGILIRVTTDDVVDLPPKQAVRQSVMTAAESTDIMFVLFIIMLITFVVIESKFF